MLLPGGASQRDLCLIEWVAQKYIGGDLTHVKKTYLLNFDFQKCKGK